MSLRQSITKIQRKELRHFAQQNPEFRQSELRNWFETNFRQKISQSTVSESLSPKFQDLDSDVHLLEAKRKRKPEHPDIEEQLICWIQLTQENIMPSHGILSAQAKLLWDLVHPESDPRPSFSTGWLVGFIKRNKTRFTRAPEIESAIDLEEESPKDDDVHMLIKNYHPANVYKCDTTHLFWKLSPDNSANIHRLGNTGNNTDRFAIHLCSNIDGTDKLEPLVVGKVGKPRAFINAKVNSQSLGCHWRHSQSGNITVDILREWLVEFDHRCVRTGKKVILLLEFSMANASAQALKNDPLRNTTLRIIPHLKLLAHRSLEHQIIGCFKVLYRTRYLRYMYVEFSANRDYLNTITELQAVKWCVQSWACMLPEMIRNCWQNTGLSNSAEIMFQKPSQISEIYTLMYALSERGCIHRAMPIEKFLNPEGEDFAVDHNTAVDEFTRGSFRITRQEYEEDQSEETPLVSHRDAMFCLDQLWTYVMQQKNSSPVYFEGFSQLEDRLFHRWYAASEEQMSLNIFGRSYKN